MVLIDFSWLAVLSKKKTTETRVVLECFHWLWGGVDLSFYSRPLEGAVIAVLYDLLPGKCTLGVFSSETLKISV